MLDASEAIKYMSTHCIRYPIGCVSSTNYSNGKSIWDQEAYDAITGDPIGYTWSKYRDSLYNTNPCQAVPCDDDTFYAQLGFNEMMFYINGFEGLIIDPDLPDGKFYAKIEPIPRDSCDIMKLETIIENCGAYGVATTDAYITFSNTNHQFGHYFTDKPYPTSDCNNIPVTYKQYESTAIGKHFNIGIGFRWKKNGLWHRECVELYDGITTSRATTTYQDTGKSLVEFHLEDPWSLVKSATIPAAYNQTVSLSQHIDNMLTYFNLPFEIRVNNYNPVFSVVSEGQTIEEFIQKLCEVGMARFFWSANNNKFIFETLDWSEIYRQSEFTIEEIDTCKDIIDLEDPIIEEGFSAVRVEQYSKSGGIESFMGNTTSGVKVITNDYIQNQSMADYIANKMYGILKYGAQSRQVKTLGKPWLEVGDIITIKERIDTDSRNGECENIYEVGNWRICKIVNNLDDGGYTQTLTVDKVGLRVYGSMDQGCFNSNSDILCGQTNDPANTVTVTIDGVDYTPVINPDGSMCINFGGLNDGIYDVTTTVVSPSGDTITTITNITIDTTPPPTPYVYALLTNSNTPTIEGEFYPDATYAVVNIDGNDYTVTNQNFSFDLPYTIDGAYTMTITSYDQCGNSSSSTNPLTIDTVPPPPPVINNIPAQNSGSFTVTGTGVSGNYIYLIVDGIFQPTPIETVVGGVWSMLFPGLPSGTHTFSAIQQDPAGNNSLPGAVKNGVVL